MLPTPYKNESWVNYWQRINKNDKTDIGLYCQSCCFRYPDDCDAIEALHPYDRMAEGCPFFVPKDYYKPLHKAKCWRKRLEKDPQWDMTPEEKIEFRIATKEKAIMHMRGRK